MRIVVAFALTVDVAEQDVASRGVGLELLEASERFKGQLSFALMDQ